MKALPKPGKGGFTFFEAICLVIVLLVLTAIFWPFKGGHSADHSRRNANRAYMNILATSIMMYDLNGDALPTTLQNLIVNPGVVGWNGPYTHEGKLPKDPWGNPYLYQNRGNRFLLFSSGPPGKNQAVVEVISVGSSPVPSVEEAHTSPEPTSNCTPQGSRPTVTPR